MQNGARVLLDYPLPEERVFRYQAMQDILHHLVNNPFEEFTQKELATITGADISSVSRSVNLLEQLGAITVSEETPAKIAIDQDHLTASNPLLTIPQEEFRKPVQTFLEEVSDDIDASEEVDELVGVVLFGSVARGTADRSSDIDLLVLVDGDATYARRLTSKLARDLETRAFDGDRYQFEVLVETPESAASRGDNLREIFDDGIIVERTDTLADVRAAVYQDDGEVTD
ncbi:nucleotidyltransferase domain-containing protein [Halobacterium sp. KA-4]|uniref:nucleotidyltransferase domain-containing protein n=1 Tax=Halobacterium sp. KA-4 TaxID=2896367 RepID=UPI001E44A0CA|nr:nucleotidyltransferase domain-containing protein [Halobacterium sp. KA-4]MCD2200878.1 nucleotidyltransferase domain-containing protein [Halobacterium sp. KA-4]